MKSRLYRVSQNSIHAKLIKCNSKLNRKLCLDSTQSDFNCELSYENFAQLRIFEGIKSTNNFNFICVSNLDRIGKAEIVTFSQQ